MSQYMELTNCYNEQFELTQREQLTGDKYLHIKNCITPDQIQDILNPIKLIEYQEQISSRRTITKKWCGACNLCDVHLQYMKFVELDDGRVDISLPKSLGLELLGEMPYKLGKIGLGEDFTIKAWNLLILPPSDKEQVWHQDNGGCGSEDYYTVLIPLNHLEGMGRTEIALPYTEKFKDYDQIAVPEVETGDALVFSGSLWHRGTPNLSKDTRYCLYMVLTRLPQDKIFESWK